MNTQVRLVFHNRGLRSFIEVDLCTRCPRQDDKGCCGYYSPVFYPLDLYYLQEYCTHILETIWKLPHLTVLDHSVTVNAFIDEGGGYRCQFHHKEGGCRLEQGWRESVCRHFVCPGLDWHSEKDLVPWRDFFSALEDYEIEVNQELARRLTARGLSLRRPEQRPAWLEQLALLVPEVAFPLPPALARMPDDEEVLLERELWFGEDWPL